LLVLAAVLLADGAPADEVRLDSDAFGGLTARAIGPAAMSGRITAIDAVETDRLTIFAGAASGGVWKSTDGGVAWAPVFDKHTQSIGAIAIDRSNPRTVWVGTGESCTRNSVSVGDGVYKSSDGGESWNHVGLEASERIARIVVHPKDSNTVYACAVGHLFDDHPERGVFRTADGGKTWKQVLKVADDTGCADLAIDPQEPKVLYAAIWQVRRRPFFFTSGGPRSGLYKTTDGGDTWKAIRSGLPAGDLGRIGLAVAPTRPSVVYAVVEGRPSGLYRSDDLGGHWQLMNTSPNVVGRPFYFAHLVVDPTDHQRVYKPGFSLTVSTDGGKTFGGANPMSGYHGDLHALWINPERPQELVLGTDGGVYLSGDRGRRWRFVGALPVSQFYHVSYDMETPYNVYGGLQDNGTWSGPSHRPGGIDNRHWEVLGRGDGFWAFVDPTDPDLVYVEYQGGHLSRVRRSTRETKDIRPYPAAAEPDYRFNWNTPIHLSPTRPGTLYYGSQFLLRSRDRGDSWERISPDLTGNDPGKQRQKESGGLTLDVSTAENHCTIFAISESPQNADLIWVGTDDGQLQVTRNGGKTWTNVVGNVPGLPKYDWGAGIQPSHPWVTGVEASRFDEASAYVVFDGHLAGDMKTHVFKTTDFGRTWQSLATPDLRGYAHVIREDPVNPRLLFLGTELGLYVSADGGAHWAQFTGGVPSVAVRDIAIHPREHDLLLATHGRGIYILDDLTPLRQLTQQVLDSEIAVFDSRPAVLSIPVYEQRFDGHDQYVGGSLEDAAFITYYQKSRHVLGDLRLEIYDGQGGLIGSAGGDKRRGINRVAWPTRRKAPKVPPAQTLVPQPFSFLGPRIAEGTYTVKLIKGKETLTSRLQVVADPRSRHSPEDRALQHQTALALYDMLGRLTYVVEAAIGARDQAKLRTEKLDEADRLRKRLLALADRLDRFRAGLVSTSEAGWLGGDDRLREKLVDLYGAVNGYQGRPTVSQLSRQRLLLAELSKAEADLQAIAEREVPPLAAELAKRKLEVVAIVSTEEWRRRQEHP
jgi:photosystem II stability/assembly factor-like uncharacterized protein